jgi:hypothetical protein
MTRTLLLAASLAVFAFDASAQLYKCVVDGKTIYQQERCPEKAKETTLRSSEPPPIPLEVEKAKDEKQAQTDDADLDRLSEVIAGYNICSEKQKDFRATNADAYNAWGTKNREAFRRYEANPESQARLKAATAKARAKASEDGNEGEAKMLSVCAKVLGTIQQ